MKKEHEYMLVLVGISTIFLVFYLYQGYGVKTTTTIGATKLRPATLYLNWFYACSSEPTLCQQCTWKSQWSVEEAQGTIWFNYMGPTSTGCVNYNAKSRVCKGGTCNSWSNLGTWNLGCGHASVCMKFGWINLWGLGWGTGIYDIYLQLNDYTDGTTTEFDTDIEIYSECADECGTAGITGYRCDPNDPNLRQKSTCGNYDADTCLEWSSWSTIENCNDRNYYSDCTWNCLDENTRRCTRNYYNYDCWNGGTSCSVVEVVDGSYSEDCSSGYECNNGQCEGAPMGVLELIFLFLRSLGG